MRRAEAAVWAKVRCPASAPSVASTGLQPLVEVRQGALRQQRFNLVLLGSFAAAALLLAAGGLYGLMAFPVGQRHGEYAIRQALGASSTRIGRLVLGNGGAARRTASAIGLARPDWPAPMIALRSFVA